MGGNKRVSSVRPDKIAVRAAASIRDKLSGSATQRENNQAAQMHALINSLEDAIIAIDNHGGIKEYNAAALDLFDTNRNIKGVHIDDLLNLVDGTGRKAQIMKIITDDPQLSSIEQYYHKFDDGEAIRLHITVSVVQSSFGEDKIKHQEYIIIARDITQTKLLEEERDDFIAVITHELRTPVAVTEGKLSNLQIIAQNENASQRVKKDISESHDQVLYLASLINDLSSLARAERKGEVLTEPIDIASFMNKLYTTYQPQAKEQKLLFNIDIDPNVRTIETNRLYLEEMLQNFITNGIKYTKEGSVLLSVTKDSGNIVFSVKDTGIGIAKTDKDRVFEKFYRSEDYRTRETSGTGLGLFVCRRLAERVGARIQLQSRLHHGSTFSITFPMNPNSSVNN